MSRSGWKADIPSQRFEKPVEPLVLVANLRQFVRSMGNGDVEKTLACITDD
jgi:hypothetical protein